MHAPKRKPGQSIDFQCCSLNCENHHGRKSTYVRWAVHVKKPSRPRIMDKHGIESEHTNPQHKLWLRRFKTGTLATTTILHRACFKRDAAELLTNSNSPGRISCCNGTSSSRRGSQEHSQGYGQTGHTLQPIDKEHGSCCCLEIQDNTSQRCT